MTATMNICGEPCEVHGIADGYARGADWTCDFCHGDPCDERSDKDATPIGRYFRDNPAAETCPNCDGRPT